MWLQPLGKPPAVRVPNQDFHLGLPDHWSIPRALRLTLLFVQFHRRSCFGTHGKSEMSALTGTAAPQSVHDTTIFLRTLSVACLPPLTVFACLWPIFIPPVTPAPRSSALCFRIIERKLSGRSQFEDQHTAQNPHQDSAKSSGRSRPNIGFRT